MESILSTVIYFIGLGLMIYSYMLLVYILLSWFPGARDTKFGEILESLCEPFLEPFRRIIPPIGMFDISPLVAFFVLRLAQSGVVYLSHLL